MKRQTVLILFTMLVFLLTSTVSVFANLTIKYQEEAEKLNVLHIFKGTDQGFELDRAPTRVEGAAIFVRLMGGEEEALENNYPHPFTDVPKWGRPYVGFLYHHNLTKGVTEDTFGSKKPMNAAAYTTFALRSIGYQDTNGDFKWRRATDKALEIELIDEEFYQELKEEAFLRDHVVHLSYLLLRQPVKDDSGTLAKKLLDYGTLTEEDLILLEILPEEADD